VVAIVTVDARFILLHGRCIRWCDFYPFILHELYTL